MSAWTNRLQVDSRMTSARLIGGLFLAGFLFYGTGFTLVSSVIDDKRFFETVPEHTTVLAVGVFLMLLNTVIDVGKGVLLFPILARHGRRTALVYLSALVVQVVFLDIGALFLLMLVPLGRIAGDAGPGGATWAPDFATLLTDSNTLAYNIGQATLCFGGVFLCLLLLRTGLIPRALAALGVVGYVVHAIGSSAELFDLRISDVMLIPGGLFEVGLALWLIAKGFRAEPYGDVPEPSPVHSPVSVTS
ncbi:MAG: DUF4386 domain-containing protein [Nocardioidaceae bacterium]